MTAHEILNDPLLNKGTSKVGVGGSFASLCSKH